MVFQKNKEEICQKNMRRCESCARRKRRRYKSSKNTSNAGIESKDAISNGLENTSNVGTK